MASTMDTDVTGTDSLLYAEHVGASWSGVQVLSDVSVSVRAGEVVCLCGPNGSGKSTLLSVLAGVTVSGLSVSGRVQIMGTDVQSVPKKQLATRRAYLMQTEECAWNYTVRDIVCMGRFSHTGVSAAYTEHDFMVTDSVLERVQIAPLAQRSVLSLSGGEFQKVRIARCLAQETDLLLLDEPLANLDFGYQEELVSFLVQLAHDEHKAVLVSIHDLNMASRFADRMILLPRLSPCFTGTVQELMAPDVLERVYGYRFGVFDHPVYGCRQVYVV